MLDRRRFLQGKLSLPLWGGWLLQRKVAAAPAPRDFFKELGVRGFINAAEPFTALTGSLMTREVAEAWDYAVPKYIAMRSGAA
jgi:D-glucosaminate-6-phosphate ammonia-lyase